MPANSGIRGIGTRSRLSQARLSGAPSHHPASSDRQPDVRTAPGSRSRHGGASPTAGPRPAWARPAARQRRRQGEGSAPCAGLCSARSGREVSAHELVPFGQRPADQTAELLERGVRDPVADYSPARPGDHVERSEGEDPRALERRTTRPASTHLRRGRISALPQNFRSLLALAASATPPAARPNDSASPVGPARASGTRSGGVRASPPSRRPDRGRGAAGWARSAQTAGAARPAIAGP
jgi:hypothetical protein